MLVGHWVSSSVNASSCPMPIFFLIISELEIIPSLAFYVPLFRFFYLNDCWFFKYCKYLFLVTCVLKIPVISYPEKILFSLIWTSVQFSCSVVSDSLRPHESQHARPPCPSPTPGVHSDRIHRVSDAIQPSHPWSSPFPPAPNPSQHQVFSNESTLHMRWPKCWSFSFSIIPSKEVPGLISFRMDWLDLLAVQGMLKSLLQHHSSKAS